MSYYQTLFKILMSLNSLTSLVLVKYVVALPFWWRQDPVQVPVPLYQDNYFLVTYSAQFIVYRPDMSLFIDKIVVSSISSFSEANNLLTTVYFLTLRLHEPSHLE